MDNMLTKRARESLAELLKDPGVSLVPACGKGGGMTIRFVGSKDAVAHVKAILDANGKQSIA